MKLRNCITFHYFKNMIFIIYCKAVPEKYFEKENILIILFTKSVFTKCKAVQRK